MTLGKMFPSSQEQPLGGWVGLVTAGSPQPSIFSVAGGSSGRLTTASTTPQLFSHETICMKSLKEGRDVVYTVRTFKMFVAIAKLLSKKLEPIYISTSSVRKCLFPNLLANSKYLIFADCQCDVRRAHPIVPTFISFIIREIDHLFEGCSGSLLFFSLICSSSFYLMESKSTSVIFSPKGSLSFDFICSVFYYKSVKPQAVYLFHYGFWVSFATYKGFILIKYSSIVFF